MDFKPRCLSAGILFADVGCAPIDHAPAPGELVQTDRVELTLGGCASNVSINLARLEVPTGLCGCVGDDAFSDHILKSLANPLVDVSGVDELTIPVRVVRLSSTSKAKIDVLLVRPAPTPNLRLAIFPKNGRRKPKSCISAVI